MTGLLAAAANGLLAGFAIAIPVGAIATLIILLAMQHGWRAGFAAGLGTATVDGLYAVVAVLFGAVLAPLIAPLAPAFRWIAAGVLVIVALLLLRSAWRPVPADADSPPLSPGRAYLRVLLLTAVNPATVVYFIAIVTGWHTGATPSVAESAIWVAGVFVASAIWQTVLATVGATAGRVLAGPAARRWTTVAGAATVLLLAVKSALGW